MHNKAKKIIESIVNVIEGEYKINISSFVNHFDKFGWNSLMELLEKKKIKLNIEQKEDLQDWFKKKQNEFFSLKVNISDVENELNQKIYFLYKLKPEEIEIIERGQ